MGRCSGSSCPSRLGLFDNPFVDEDAASVTVSREDFRTAGYAAQARSVTVLQNGVAGSATTLPLTGAPRIYAENLSDEAVATLGDRVSRPAVLTPLLPFVSVLVGSYGTSDDAVADVLAGRIAPEGRLPFDLPRSMEQVRQHPADVPGLGDPLYPFGFGLTP